MKLSPEQLADAVVDTIKKTVDGPQIAGRIAELEQRIKELESELARWKAQPFIKNGGVWRHGSTYTLGDVAQFQSTRWVCTKAHTASGAPDHACWQLWSKSGPKDDFR